MVLFKKPIFISLVLKARRRWSVNLDLHPSGNFSLMPAGMSNTILYLCHSGLDYLQDGLYHGLTSRLGKENVVDWPRQARFHEPIASTIPSLGLLPGNEPARPLTSWGLCRQLRGGRFGVVMVAAGRKGAFAAWQRIMAAGAHLPAVFIDGGDHIELAGQLAWERKIKLRNTVLSKRNFDLIFKREHRGQEANDPKVLPISFCLPENHFPFPSQATAKTRDVAFWGSPAMTSRKAAIQLLKNVRDFERNRSQAFRGADYLRELAATKVGLSFWGAGDDTLRYWEIPCTGSLLLAQKPRGPVPDNFVHGHEAVFVQDDLSDLVEQVNYYCDHDEEREKIAAAGRQKFLQHHTTVARARYVLDALKERRLFSS
jgi:hypothetical protein